MEQAKASSNKKAIAFRLLAASLTGLVMLIMPAPAQNTKKTIANPKPKQV